jgi:predicted MFS family arabinose efflux permease
VSIAPTVSGLTTERSRPFGFSLVFAFGIGIGALAGLTIGKMHAVPLQPTLLAACALAALGALPALRLRLTGTAPDTQRVYPSNPFVYRFLFALCIWSFATGMFNPFFSAYFIQALHIPVPRIGLFFSIAQVAQVLAVLCAPIVIRRLGLIGGVMAMQLATASMLAMFALGPAGYIAGGAYAAYMAFQYMSEPGMYSLLMDGVTPQERSGASALNFLAISGSQAVAAAVAGFGVRRFGYSVVLALAALVALIASLAFRSLSWNRVPTYCAAASKLTNADAGV